MTVWQAWHNAAAEYKGCRVVGYVPGYGVFDIRQGTVYRIFDGTRNQIGTARPAIAGELSELDWAASHGCLQIEVRPVTGIFQGQCGSGISSSQMPTIIVWQAKGIQCLT